MKMDIVKTFIVEDIISKEQIEWIVLDRGNGEYTSMPKAIWDEQQKAAELGGTL